MKQIAWLAVPVIAILCGSCFRCSACEPIDTPWCGDAVCDDSEACCSTAADSQCCPMDCPVDCGFCGDGVCDPEFETVFDCPVDCAVCGDGLCSASVEDPINCSTDCGLACACGDGICDPTCGEECVGCGIDCGPCGGGLRSEFTTGPAGVSAFWIRFAPDGPGAYSQLSGCWGETVEPPGTGDVSYSVVLAADDDSGLVTLPFPFPFYDTVEVDLWVSANGFVTFGPQDTSGDISLAVHDAFRRISPAMSDLAGGTIIVDQFLDHVNINWLGWGSPQDPALLDIYLTLWADGSIRFLWSGQAPSYPLILGISDGAPPGAPLWVIWPLC